MSKLTGKEIIELFKKSGMEVSNFAYNEKQPFTKEDRKKWEIMTWGDPNRQEFRKAASERSFEAFQHLPEYEEIDQKGGEGEGDNWWSVKYFPEHDVYLKVTGFYQSHYGTDFEEWDYAVREVTPKEVKVTIYE